MGSRFDGHVELDDVPGVRDFIAREGKGEGELLERDGGIEIWFSFEKTPWWLRVWSFERAEDNGFLAAHFPVEIRPHVRMVDVKEVY